MAVLSVLLLAFAWPHAAASPPKLFNSYIINPASHLDVVTPARYNLNHEDFSLVPAAAAAAAGCSRGNSINSTSTSSSTASATGIHGEPAICPEHHTDTSTDSKTHKRVLLQGPANPLRVQEPYLVCVSPWAPMVQCDPNTDPAGWKGYQVELFRMLAKEVGWAEGDYTLTCMDQNAMMADLLDPAGNCSLSATGIEVSPENLAAGIKFSWPTYKSGLRVMIHAHLQTGSTWAFANIFAWQVWLVLGVTGPVVGLLVALLEYVSECWKRVDHINNWSWYVVSQLVSIVPAVGDPGADASRVLVLGYGFLLLVMISMYTAMAASQLTAAALVHPVHSLHDLAGKDNPYKTQTWEKYVDKLDTHHHVHASGKAWETEHDLAAMIKALRDEKYSALILDAPVLEYVTSHNAECDLFLVGEVIETFSLALAFPPAFDDSDVYAFSRSIVKLQTYQGALDMLENVYIKTGGTAKCFGDRSTGGHGSGETIELFQVSGLWYILLIAVGACFMLTLARNIRKNRRDEMSYTLRRLGSALGKWSAAGEYDPHEHGSVVGSVGGTLEGAAPGQVTRGRGSLPGWLRGGRSPVHAVAVVPAGGGVAVQNATAGAAAVQGQGQLARSGGSMEMRGYWGQTAAQPAFAELFSGSKAVPK